MTAIREVVAADCIEQITELLRANWAETGFDFELDPSPDFYRALQSNGLLIALAAFEGETIVGYSTAVVTPHPFNPAVMFCMSDALYVHPVYRRGLTAYRLIKETERIALARGARFMTWHTRAGTSMASMLEMRGYKPADVCVMRELKDDGAMVWG